MILRLRDQRRLMLLTTEESENAESPVNKTLRVPGSLWLLIFSFPTLKTPSARLASAGHGYLLPQRQEASKKSSTPAVMALSATLKAGQW